MIRVTVWNEYEHERNEERVAKVYPKGGAQGISFAGRFAIDELNKWELA